MFNECLFKPSEKGSWVLRGLLGHSRDFCIADDFLSSSLKPSLYAN